MKSVQLPITEHEATLIVQFCEAAWRQGGIRDPRDGKLVEDLKAKVAAAFPRPMLENKPKEPKDPKK